MQKEIGFKKIFGNSLWQISEKVLTMIIGIVVSAWIARYLGVHEYGTANYIISIVSLFTAFSTLGMEKIIINDIIKQDEEKEVILGTSFILRIIGGIVLLLVSQITIYILNGENILYQILGAIMGTCMIFKAFEVIEYYFQAKMNLKLVSIIRFITAILVALSKIVIIKLDFGVIGFLSTYLFDSIVAGLLFYILFKINNKSKWSFSKKYTKQLLSKCWYVALAGIMTTVYMRIDQVMLGSMLDTKIENGIYSAAVRIAEMWYFVPIAVISSFQPVIIKKKKKSEEEYINMVQRLYDLVALIGIAFGIGISIFGGFAIDILYGSEYQRASNILVISVWAGLFATLGSARSVWLVVENKQKFTVVYTLTGCVINIILNSILIPFFGAAGAAVATLIAQVVANIFALMMFKETRKSSLMILKSIFCNKTIIDMINYLKKRKKHV